MTTPCLPSLFSDDASPVSRPTNPVAKEIARLNAAAQRVLERLNVGPATNVELSQPSIGGLRFGGRLHELGKHGWTIGKEHVSGGVWIYRLIK